MKRLIAALLALLLLSGCGANEPESISTEVPAAPTSPVQTDEKVEEVAFQSRFSTETLIELSDSGIKTADLTVFASNDIIYYEDIDLYESGNPYGEGEAGDKHSADEAAAHRGTFTVQYKYTHPRAAINNTLVFMHN